MAKKQKSNSTGMDMIMAANGGVEELDISGEAAGEVIDPKAIAEAVSKQANETEDEESNPLDIIDDTNDNPKTEEKELEKEDELKIEGTGLDIKKDEEVKTEDKKEELKDKKEEVEEGDPETFKILGEHFSNEGILDGYEGGDGEYSRSFPSYDRKNC